MPSDISGSISLSDCRTVWAPPSKSVSHRMLIGAALAKGRSTVAHVLESKDIERTCAVLAAAGAAISTPDSSGTRSIDGMGGCPRGGTKILPMDCYVHESGTTCRMLTAILAAGHGVFHLHGAGRMHERPLGVLTAALEGLGAHIHYVGRPGYLPLNISTKGLKGGTTCIGVDESSQYLSGLLLAAPCMEQGLTVTLCGERAVSWPYVGLTLQTLEDFAIPFTVETRASVAAPWKVGDWHSLPEARPDCLRFHVPHAQYRAGTYTVEGDWSGASFLLAAGAVGQHPVLVHGLRAASLQGDKAMLDIVRAMGADICWCGDGVLVRPSPLHGIDVDMRSCPDLVPVVAVMAAFAQGITRIRHVQHLRIKESDRIAAPAHELRKARIRVDEMDDGLTVYGLAGTPIGKPTTPAGTIFSAHGDHRIAMSLALLELAGVDMHLDTPAVVDKSFPHFWQVWKTLR